jgi:hypothetical protein
MISAAHSATPVSSSSGMVSPPGERSHAIPYPASPSRYQPGRDLGRAARWQPRAHGQRSTPGRIRAPAWQHTRSHVPRSRHVNVPRAVDAPDPPICAAQRSFSVVELGAPNWTVWLLPTGASGVTASLLG